MIFKIKTNDLPSLVKELKKICTGKTIYACNTEVASLPEWVICSPEKVKHIAKYDMTDRYINKKGFAILKINYLKSDQITMIKLKYC